MTDDEIDENAILARVEVVADVLGLPYAEVEAAMASEKGLLEFGWRYHQSFDWLIEGDVRGMIAARARP